MQLSPYEIALIAGGFTIIGTILGTWLTFRFSLRLADITSELHLFNVTAQKLRDAFILVRTKVNDTTITDPCELETILLTEFPKQQLAVTEFLFILNPKYYADFNKTWREYYEWQNRETQPKEPCFVQYTMPDDHGEISPASRELAIKRIDSILSFAKRKTFLNIVIK